MTDKELGQTKTVKMRINKRKLVEEAVNEMMDSGMVERSKSPWCFHIVIVEKKDGGGTCFAWIFFS